MTAETACSVVQPSDIAAPFLEEIKNKLAAGSEKPLLVAFLANDDPAAKRYAEWTGRTCRQANVDFELRQVQRTQLEDAILEANRDPKVNGMMCYYPVFGGTQDQYLQNIVDINKDVEGLSHQCRVNMYHNVRFLDTEQKQKCILPCTPLAVIKIMEHIGAYNKILPYGNRLYGRTITVINRSEVVGRPLAALLANDGAKVYSADEFGILEFHRGEGIRLTKHEVFETKATIEQALAASDVVITGVPTDKYRVDTAKLKDGVIAINFSSSKNFNDDIVSKASIYVSSVGKVTVSMLLRNLLRLAENQAIARDEEHHFIS
ncbi:hypothetical protein SmJEL517_g02945 [Synchytrium microbalum]|uniref:Tetrahydrofolate dehydrogenase/cyclohydrolase NAD(P)-binding domain-containing protein n=1 Tax=Synchytrium microbalum TaxID=1806994 RepID=A0A507C3T0_9FUNG|nr:uncharacterized protein SmJEL517_g02945 [Synchytrium microbalum]TPX34332.1 hypothetical protein SmJEL517_g02945 [Synchytrium microbalum]